MLKKTLITTAGVFLTANMAMATSVGVIDAEKIFNNSSMGMKKLKADQAKMQPELDKLNKEITDLQVQIESFENARATAIVDANAGDTKDSANALNAEGKDELAAKKSLQLAIESYQKIMNKAQEKITIFEVQVKSATAEVAKKNNLDIILPSNLVIYNTDSIDITNQVISAIK